MATCSLDVLKKTSERKAMRRKKGKAGVLQQAIIYSGKEAGK